MKVVSRLIWSLPKKLRPNPKSCWHPYCYVKVSIFAFLPTEENKWKHCPAAFLYKSFHPAFSSGIKGFEWVLEFYPLQPTLSVADNFNGITNLVVHKQHIYMVTDRIIALPCIFLYKTKYEILVFKTTCSMYKLKSILQKKHSIIDLNHWSA